MLHGLFEGFFRADQCAILDECNFLDGFFPIVASFIKLKRILYSHFHQKLSEILLLLLIKIAKRLDLLGLWLDILDFIS